MKRALRGSMCHLIGVACGLVLAASGAAAATNPDLPPVGRSLFDHLTARQVEGRSVQRVPYPFEALLAELKARAGEDALGRPGLAAVLIPVGRSLQRNAAAGDYFRHPRIVAAVTGEPHRLDASGLLRDRVFLGFQDQSGILEVISYNERAGRYEFQIVTGYRAGAEPQVLYARRAVCMTCHQGGGPIFSRPSWDETNANPAVARALRVHATRIHGIEVVRGVDVPNAIDDSVARANRVALTQILWRQGCAALGASEAPACRAEALFAALRIRLAASGRAGSYRAPGSDARLRKLSVAWRAHWPDGLPEPDPNIANRDPFFGRAQQLGSGPAALPYAGDDIPPALDPMAARAPIAYWRGDEAGVQRFIRSLGEMLASADIDALARALDKTAKAVARRSAVTGARTAKVLEDHESFAPLLHALGAMVEDTVAGRSTVFADTAFQRVPTMLSLLRHLGMPVAAVCCDADDTQLPAARAEAAALDESLARSATMQPFYEHCGVCHALPVASPPGFLAGSATEVARSLQRCAPRIRYRLSMWQVQERERPKLPMPPPVFVPSWGHAPPHEDIARMLRVVEATLDAPMRARPLSLAYEALPPCRERHPAQ